MVRNASVGIRHNQVKVSILPLIAMDRGQVTCPL